MNSKQAAASWSRVFNRAAAMLATTLFVLAFAGEAAAQAGFSKQFIPDTIGVGSTSALTFTITNPSLDPITDLTFTDVLPAGLVLASPASPTLGADCNLSAVVDAPDGGTTVTFTSPGLGAGATCTLRVDVIGSTPGAYDNISGNLTSSAGNSGPATDTLTIATDRPGFTKSFSPDSVQFGANSTLTFTIDNSLNGSVESGLAFTDALPVGLEIASPANPVNTCNGVLNAAAGSTTISLTSGFVLANASCTISVDVQATGVGRLDNRTSDLSIVGGTSGRAIDTIDVMADELALTKSFINDPAPPGETTTLEFRIINLDRDETVTDISFTDDLDATLTGLVATGLPANDVCGAGSTLTGTGLLTLSGATLGPGANCTFQVTLQVPTGATSGNFPNTTSTISGNDSIGSVVGSGATDTLVVDVFPLLTKEFVDDPVGAGGTTILEFTIVNSSSTSSATDIAFTDDLGATLSGLVANSLVASSGTEPDPLVDPCGPGSALTIADPNDDLPSPPFPALPPDPSMLVFTGGNLAPGDSCTFQVTLDVPDGTSTGSFANTTSEITATVDSDTRTGPAATDTLDVVGAPRLSKSFTDDPVDPGATVTLEFTLEHDEFAPGTTTDIAFTDDLNNALAGLVAMGLPQTDICGIGSEISGTSLLSFSGGSLAVGETCTFNVTLQVPPSAPPGVHTNITTDIMATVDGLTTTGQAASDDLLISAVELTKLFIGDPVLPGASVPLRFTITNENPDFDATNISFIDDLSAVLPGLVATGLPLTNVCGTGSQVSGTSNLVFTGGTLTPEMSCTFDVTVLVPAGTTTSTYFNVTSSGSATLNGVSIPFNNAQDDLVVDNNLLSLSKEFTDDPAVPGGTVTLEFTVTNTSPSDTINDIAFTDDLDAVFTGLVSVSGSQSNVCGSGSALSGSSVLTLAGGELAPGETCTFSATLSIPASASGSAFNTTSTATGTMGGLPVEGIAASDALSINNVTFAKSFSGPTTATGTVTLSFTLENLDAGNSVIGLSFTDDLDAVIAGLIATDTPQADLCGAGSQLGGTSLLTFTGGELGPGASCTFDVELQVPASATPGSFNNTTSNLTSNGLLVSDPASDVLQIEPPPAFDKEFIPSAIALGGSTTLSFTIDNSASAVAATSLVFTDNLPAGLAVAGTPNASSTCIGGTLTATAGTGTIAYSGGSVAAGAQCTLQVDIVGIAEGTFVNTSSALTSTAGDSGTATDTIDVITGDFVMIKSFRTQPVLPGGLVEMELSVVNGSGFALTDIALTDDLEAVIPGLAAEGLPIANVCGAGSLVAGTSTVTLTGGDLLAGGSCTLVVPVRVPADAPTGTFTNTTSIASGIREGVPVEAPAASADLVVEPLTFTKTFDPSFVDVGSTTTVTYEITNPDPANAVTGLAFTDDLEAFVSGMTAVNTPINNACGADSLVDGTSTIALTDGTLAAGGSCSFQVVLTIPADTPTGEYTSVSSDLTSNLGNSGNASAVLTVGLAAALPMLNTLWLILLALLLAAIGWRALNTAAWKQALNE